MNKLFQGVKPCHSCTHYAKVNNEHTCKQKRQLTQTARLIGVECHNEKRGK